MKLVIQLYTWEIFMFIPVNKYRICDSPGYVYAKCMHMLVEYTFRKHFNIFPDQKSIETRRKKYMHARARRRGEKKKQKAWIKWEKEGKSGKPRIELVERKERRGRARKRAVLHAFAFSLLAAFVPVVFLQLLVSNLYHAIFHPMKFVSSPIYIIWEWRKRSPRNAITSATIFLNEGARADALTNDSRFSNSRKKKKKLRYWVRENLFLNIDPYVTLILLRCFFIHPRFEGESDFKRASRWSPHGDSLWVTQWKLRKI